MPEPIHISAEGRRKGGSVGWRARRDVALAAFAGGRDGIVTTPELLRLGFSEGTIGHQVRFGHLHRLFQGVYAVGHRAITQRGRWRAAVAACGGGALLSHRSAAALWGLPIEPPTRPEVTVAHGGPGCQGIDVHRTTTINKGDRSRRQGIPVTAPSRTLVDIAGLMPCRALKRAVIEAERMRLLDPLAVLARCGRGRRGSGRLRAIVESELAPAVAARSELELRFQDLCQRYEILTPEVNVFVEGFMVDAYWPRASLVVELDGDNYHRTAGDRRRDAARDRALALASVQVLRFGWDDVTASARATAEAVLTMLRRRTDPSFR